MKISALIEVIKSQYRQPPDRRRPIFAQGSPGVGKTDAFMHAASDLGISHMSLQATIEDPITLSGLPARAQRAGQMEDEAIFLPFQDNCRRSEGILTSKCNTAPVCAIWFI